MSEFTGKVTIGLFGEGTKSEHKALYLETEDRKYVLRRKGANPFFDPELRRLIGKTIRCSGFIIDYVLTIDEWSILG